MTSARRFLTAVAVFLIAASVALADGVDEARRYLGFAQDQVRRNDNLEQAIDYCGRAEKALASVPEGQKAALLAEIQTTLDQAKKQQRERKIKNLDGMIQREYVQLEEACKGQGNRGAGLDEVDEVEPLFERIENLLRMDDVVKTFDAAHMAEWRSKIDALHGLAMRTVYDTCVKQAEERITELENENAAGGKLGSDAEERWKEYAQQEISKLADSDKRKEPLQKRLDAAVAARRRRVAGDAREEAVTAARAYWALMQEKQSGSSQRWQTENAYEFNTWWREHGRLNLEKTEQHFLAASRTIEDERYQVVAKEHADDQRVKDLMKEVLGVAGEASKKTALAADKLLTQAEAKIAESGATEVKERALTTLRSLELMADYSPEGKAALEKCRALINRCHEIEVNGTDPGAAATPPPTATSGGSPTPTAATEAAEAPGPGPEGVEASGGLGILPMLLGCGCCSLLLVAGGGGAFFMMKKQQAAAAPPKP